MIVTYRCGCGHIFNGHWDQAKLRRQQFPDVDIKSNALMAMICPKCGDMNKKKNIDNDEDFSPEPPSEERE